jgi:AcrR family transcriptional regulator
MEAKPPPAGTPTATPTEERIIGAAIGLIGQDGLGGVRMSAVAKAAGVSRQTLYNHFPDVDSILTAAIHHHNQEAGAMLTAALAITDSPAGKLDQLVRHVVMLGSHGHGSQRITDGLSADSRAGLAAHEQEMNSQIAAILDEGKRTGAFRADLTSDVDVLVVAAMLDGIMDATSRAPDEAALVAQAGLRTLLRAVQSDPEDSHL